MKKILVVDDEINQVETIRRGLRLYGYESIGTTDAEEAWAILQGADGGSVSMLLTDLTMPGCSGCELIRRVRTDMPDLPVVVFTGINPNPDAEHLDRYRIPILQKPFEPENLCATVRANIGEP